MINYNLIQMRHSFEQSIIENQSDNSIKLIYSDWLDENGYSKFSDNIRFCLDKGKFPVWKSYKLKEGEEEKGWWLWWEEEFIRRHDFAENWPVSCYVDPPMWKYFRIESKGHKFFKTTDLFHSLEEYCMAWRTHWDGLTLFDRLER